jgi:hypothetical protein
VSTERRAVEYSCCGWRIRNTHTHTHQLPVGPSFGIYQNCCGKLTSKIVVKIVLPTAVRLWENVAHSDWQKRQVMAVWLSAAVIPLAYLNSRTKQFKQLRSENANNYNILLLVLGFYSTKFLFETLCNLLSRNQNMWGMSLYIEIPV